jgi:hypothetical protein
MAIIGNEEKAGDVEIHYEEHILCSFAFSNGTTTLLAVQKQNDS